MEAGGTSLVIPIEVRWNTHCDSLESYLKNWTILFNICEENRDSRHLDNDIAAKVKNVGIKRSAEDIIKLLKPIAVALDKTQSNSCKIAETVLIWKELEERLEHDSYWNADDKKKFYARYEFVLTDAHFAAFLMSPKMWLECQKSEQFKLKAEEVKKATQFMEDNFNLTFMNFFFKYSGQIGCFNREGFSFQDDVISSMTDFEWWKSFQALHSVDVSEKNLHHLNQLHTGTSSSAGVERTFSKFGLIHTALRNKLGVEKAAKLVFISQQLNPKK